MWRSAQEYAQCLALRLQSQLCWIQHFWFKYTPGRLSLEMIVLENIVRIAADTALSLFHYHSVSAGLLLSSQRTKILFWSSRYKEVKTPSGTASYCFNTFLSNCRQREDARQTVRHSLPALIAVCVCVCDMRLAIAPGPTVHWLFRSHDLPSKYRPIQCSSVAHVLHV